MNDDGIHWISCNGGCALNSSEERVVLTFNWKGILNDHFVICMKNRLV